MSQLQEREKKAYDILAGNRGQRKGGGGYQRYMRGPVTPVKKEEKAEEAPRRHWAELLTVIEKCDQIIRIYNVDRDPYFEPNANMLEEEPEVVWSVPQQFKAPAPITDGKKIDVNTMAVMHSLSSNATAVPAEPAASNGNAASLDLPMLQMQMQMLSFRPKV